VWLLVTPGNPLKHNDGLPPIEDRVRAARKLIRHPQIRVTGVEAAHGFRYSYEVIRHLTRALPDRRFVWIMGADNLRDFHHWERWRDIAQMIPMAVYVRPGSELRAPVARAATTFARYRIEEKDAELLAIHKPPAWVFLHGLMSALSSTDIRARRKA
jgi:nicotinate-nucleotide adenylyltransferase